MEKRSHQSPVHLPALPLGGNINDVPHFGGCGLNAESIMEVGKQKVRQCSQFPESYNFSGTASCYRPVDSSFDMDIQKGTYPWHPMDGVPMNVFPSSQQHIGFQKQEPNDVYGNVSQPNPGVAVGATGFQPKRKSLRDASRRRATVADRLRKLRISHNLEKLQELLPYPKEGNRASISIMEDVIDHIKFLQHQLKDLSRSRLGGEPTSNSSIFLEVLNGPLEEMMGKLLEANPFEATQLLESRGLFFMPMPFVHGSPQPI